MNLKQVIVIRKDLKMRRGKEIAQGSHAAMAFLVHKYQNNIPLTELEKEWVANLQTKVCVRVNTEQELLGIQQKAKDLKLEAHLIKDAGLTEFGGIPTYTCLAIGPDLAERIDLITGQLELY